MKKINFILILFLFFGVQPFQAQIRSFAPNKRTKLKLESPRYVKVSKVKNRTVKKEPDYVLYRNIVRQYSWIVGQGDPITQEVADHLPYYFKLSLKNEKGHWQHIQALRGDSFTQDHGLGTYILNPNTDMSEENWVWREKLSRVCQWYITSDLSGELVVEERAYDKSGNMIYGFQPVKNGRNRVVGSYINDYGYPVDINEAFDDDTLELPVVDENMIFLNKYINKLDSLKKEDKSYERNNFVVYDPHLIVENYKKGVGNSKLSGSLFYNYGNVVMITYDSHGYDSIIDYLDGAGLRRQNNDGVDQRRYLYDRKGRILRVTSNNAVGDCMINNWGICGDIYKYNDIDNSYIKTHVDDELKPMRMPSGWSGILDTYISCKVILDKWGRKKEMIFLDAEGNPDVTLAGIHRVVYEYSDTGILLKKMYFDMDDNLIAF